MSSSPLRAPAPLILVVEDHGDALDLTCSLLEHRGYRTTCATDGEQAIVMARALAPDLVILDLYMPNCSGMEAARSLRSDPDTRDIPILVTTCDGSDERRREMTPYCDGYFVKPTDLRELLASIDLHAPRHGARR